MSANDIIKGRNGCIHKGLNYNSKSHPTAATCREPRPTVFKQLLIAFVQASCCTMRAERFFSPISPNISHHSRILKIIYNIWLSLWLMLFCSHFVRYLLGEIAEFVIKMNIVNFLFFYSKRIETCSGVFNFFFFFFQ